MSSTTLVLIGSIKEGAGRQPLPSVDDAQHLVGSDILHRSFPSPVPASSSSPFLPNPSQKGGWASLSNIAEVNKYWYSIVSC